ncbi:MAG: hypothetical protein U1F58_01325 [Burkholderiales bacterium]
MQLTPRERFTVPLGGQEIELQDVLHAEGGLHLLRVRIRERTRFTVFDVDAATARQWAAAMARWADDATAATGGPAA